MITSKVYHISIRVLQPEIISAKSSLKNIKVIVAVARTIKNHLTIVRSDGDLLNDTSLANLEIVV